jgi:hypothetical protein
VELRMPSPKGFILCKAQLLNILNLKSSSGIGKELLKNSKVPPLSRVTFMVKMCPLSTMQK